MLGRALLIWLAMMVLAVLNGAFREAKLRPRLGEQKAHVASTIILCGLILALTWLTLSWIGPQTMTEASWVGTGWLGLTVSFEFLAGHYLFKNPWEKILADYNLAKGRVWPIVLLTTLLAPILVTLAATRATPFVCSPLIG